MKTAIWSVSLPLLFFALAAVADEAHVTMHKIDANGVGETAWPRCCHELCP